MNTKFSFVLLMVVVALIAAACAPAIVDSAAPAEPAAPAANSNNSAVLPVTGASTLTTPRDQQSPRLWSGAISVSDTGNPDDAQNAQPAASQNTEAACMSEDSSNKQQSGCTE